MGTRGSVLGASGGIDSFLFRCGENDKTAFDSGRRGRSLASDIIQSPWLFTEKFLYCIFI
jgi:hypothetical protein